MITHESQRPLHWAWSLALPRLRSQRRPSGLNAPAFYGAVLTGLGYYAGAKLGLALTFQPHPISVLWPPNSILLAALLLIPARSWWLVILAAFIAHLVAELQGGVPVTMVLCWFISNSLQAL